MSPWYSLETVVTNWERRCCRRFVSYGTPAIYASLRALANMTTYGYTIVMKQVKIAQLKARLSQHLREVRRGATISVLDGQTPIAQIVPIRANPGLVVRKPAVGSPTPGQVKAAKPANL
jgi:antitoxin (DNA-binding transcriptional repressor) of toxin-antitoxin stability system